MDEVISPTGGSARIQTRVEVGVDDMFLGVLFTGQIWVCETNYSARLWKLDSRLPTQSRVQVFINSSSSKVSSRSSGN